jgi:heat shock protein HtpX
MIGTLGAYIAISTLVVLILSIYFGAGLLFGITIALIFNIIQWILAPKIIEAIYHVKPLSRSEAPWIHEIVERLSSKLGMEKPQVMIARIDIPNAFAYGSILGKKKVAVTTGLLKTLEEEEVEAVIGHELGHIKHRDVTAMMFLSVIPALLYYLYQTMFYMSFFSGMYGGRDRDSSPIIYAAIGIVSLIFYFIINLIVLGFSRLREYYADYEAATNIDDGARKLMEGLAKLAASNHRVSRSRRVEEKRDFAHLNSFKALLIADPDTYQIKTPYIMGLHDAQLVEEILERRVTWKDRLLELFSTHPNIVKRIKRLKELEAQGG